MPLMDTIMEFESRISPVFEELSIKVISITTAHSSLQDYSIDFEFFTQTKLNTFTKVSNDTYYKYAWEYSMAPISIGHQHVQASLFIIPQSVHIECNYKLLQMLTTNRYANVFYSILIPLSIIVSGHFMMPSKMLVSLCEA
ncbi:hypothetical protein LSPH24S_05852 [Lysinibacillus sphaericus]